MHRLIPVILASLALFFAATPARSQEVAAPDPRALFTQTLDFVKALEALSFDADISAEVKASDGESKSTLALSILLEGENKGRVRSSTPEDEAIIYADGSESYVHLVKRNEYVKVTRAIADRRDLVTMVGSGAVRVAVTWLGEYLTKFPEVETNLLSAEYVGRAPLSADNATQADQLKLAYENFDVILFLTTGEQPAPLRFVVDFTKAMAKQGGALQSIIITTDIRNWNTAPEIAADAFGWRPSAEMAAYEPEVPKQPGANTPELGKPAPDFKLADLSGTEVSLSAHKGKDVVVLDFFASWCGPCRTAMPMVHELTEAYEDKGVKLYAVNLRETPEKVNQFLQSAKLEGMAVLMDKSGQVGMDYGAMSIPRMVVIGKDGTVQAIYSGFSPSLKQQLADNLDKLLAGESLVDVAKAS